MIAPGPGLARLVNTFYVIETEAGRVEEIVPAYSAQLLLVIRGRLTMSYADGTTGFTNAIAFNAPQLRAAPCVLEGPAMLIGASLTPIGWQSLANQPVDETHDCLLPADAMLTAEQVAALEAAAAACRNGQLAPADLCAPLGAIVAEATHAPRPDHVAVVEAITAWLASGFDPPLSDLHAAIPVSPRQLQRIARRYFGVPPRKCSSGRAPSGQRCCSLIQACPRRCAPRC